MSCKNVKNRISPLLDRKLSAGERENILAHLESCRNCSAHLESLQQLWMALHSLRQPAIPAHLTARLRVAASHAGARQVANATMGSRGRAWVSSVQLWFDNLMRPVALPFAGGLFSAMALFSILLPTLSFSHNFVGQDFLTNPDGFIVLQAPNGTYLPASRDDNIVRILRSDSEIADYTNVVWLTVDENGKVCDFALQRGRLSPELEDIIMLSRFDPAMSLGSPRSAKVYIGQRVAERIVPRGRTIRS